MLRKEVGRIFVCTPPEIKMRLMYFPQSRLQRPPPNHPEEGVVQKRCFCAVEGESDRAESLKCVVLESSSISGLAEVAGGVPKGVSRPDFAPGLADEIGGIPYGSFSRMNFYGGMCSDLFIFLTNKSLLC